mgnify:CR=1 FL=1
MGKHAHSVIVSQALIVKLLQTSRIRIVRKPGLLKVGSIIRVTDAAQNHCANARVISKSAGDTPKDGTTYCLRKEK